MKRLLRNSILFLIIAVMVVMASRVYEIPRTHSGGIKGNTPLEKTQSLVESLNQNPDYKTFGTVSLAKIYYGDSIWYYTVMIHRTLNSISDDQELFRKYISLMEDILVGTSEFDFVKEIRLVSFFVDLKADSVVVTEDALNNIRRYPQNWRDYLSQEFYDVVLINSDEEESPGE